MTAGARVAGFGALLAAIFVLAAIAGRAAGPTTIVGDDDEQQAGAAASPHGEAPADAAAPELRIVAAATTLTPGRPQQFSFEIRDAAGERVRDFEVEQGRRMHLIVVRRDLRRFQHLHPRQDAAGRWSVQLTLPDAGVYHPFADFQTAGRRQTVGVDLYAAGRFAPLPLPPESTVAHTDGYDVTLGFNHTGALTFAVSRDGAEVTDLQPYLGARGHLVLLRAGDLAYAHAHPQGADAHTHAVQDDGGLAFDDTDGADPGTYRLFLQFRHRDAVHTAAFTLKLEP